MHLKSGTSLQNGKYRIERFISSGGFGCTYEAQHVMLKKRIAIKEFFVKDFCNRDAGTGTVSVATQNKVALINHLKKKFLEEAVSLSQMSHPNIVKVTDVFEENGTVYYVMDFVDGSSLAELVKLKGKLSEQETLSYIRQVADALDYVHKMNRLHLDIKPGNIMLDSKGHAILIDFGVSKQYDSIDGENTSTLMGKTPGYAPIEQMGNSVQQFTPATDIYALGATMYKLLTGVTPPESTIIIEDGIPEMDSYISKETKSAVTMAMEFRRKDRQQSMKEFLSMLPSDFVLCAEENVEIPASCDEEVRPVQNEILEDETSLDDFSDVYVDLGLSVKWATCNIGAKTPWQIGSLLGWADASTCEQSQNLELYPNANPPMSISGGQYDVATASLGDKWRIPTEKEIEELRKECKFIRDSKNGIDGYSVIGKNGNVIFLPFTGYRHGTVIKENYDIGNYWSGTLHQSNSENAYYMFMTKDYITLRDTRRYFGFAIRPVYIDN